MSNYAKQKLYEALNSLVGTGTLQQRLTFAALPLVVLNGDQGLPDEIVGPLRNVVEKLTQEPLADQGTHVPRRIDNEEAVLISKEIRNGTLLD